MTVTYSGMIPLGTPLPDFSLEDAYGRRSEMADMRGERGTLIAFICNHCPYVKHIMSGVITLAKECHKLGIGVVGINSNDVSRYPQDSPENMRREIERLGIPFPYLCDDSQEVAREFQAACTPDFYLYDSRAILVYRGQLDSSRPGNGIPVTGKDLRAAIDALLNNRDPIDPQLPSCGCNIKWKTNPFSDES